MGKPSLAIPEHFSYVRAFLAITVMIASVVFLALFFRFARIERVYRPVELDLSSLGLRGKFAIPDARNPCIVVQEHLEFTRRGRYDRSYEMLSSAMKGFVSRQDFISNVRGSGLLLEHIKGYKFPRYKSRGSEAVAKGRILYSTGESSLVEARFVRESGEWKISRLLVYME